MGQINAHFLNYLIIKFLIGDRTFITFIILNNPKRKSNKFLFF